MSFSFYADLHTIMGITLEKAAAATLEWGADVVRKNCGIGPDEVEQSIIKMIEVDLEALFWTEPNAGIPQLKDGHAVYKVGTERIANYAEKVARMGVKIIGTCCGSTPDNIRAMVEPLENCLK